MLELETVTAMSTHPAAACSNTKVQPCSNSKLPTQYQLTSYNMLEHKSVVVFELETSPPFSCDMIDHVRSCPLLP